MRYPLLILVKYMSLSKVKNFVFHITRSEWFKLWCYYRYAIYCHKTSGYTRFDQEAAPLNLRIYEVWSISRQYLINKLNPWLFSLTSIFNVLNFLVPEDGDCQTAQHLIDITMTNGLFWLENRMIVDLYK